MATTCTGTSILVSLLLLPPLVIGQSLEDKVSETRRLQAQSLLGRDEATIDSLIRERKRQRQPTGAVSSIQTNGDEDDELVPVDSLIAGPERIGLKSPAHSDLTDTAKDGDSGKGKKPPRRFEQRIFGSVDRSAFSSSRGAVGRDHILGPGDHIVVSLWGDREKQYDLSLDNGGKVFMEGIGQVALAGMSLAEAQAALKQRLSKVYSGISRGTAHVDLTLGKAGPVKIFVLGEVKLPGGFVLTGNSSILTAMYFAEGPTDIGTVRNLQLTRGGKKIPLDLYRYLIHGESLNPDLLRDGDILYSGRAAALVEIMGDVGRPATYELKKGEGVKDLLEFAARLNPTAASHKMTLQRILPGGQVGYVELENPQDYLTGKANMELQDGDRILVERSSEQSRNFLTVSGPVKYPGIYSADGVGSVKELIRKAGGLREDAFLGRVHVVRLNPDGSSQLFAYSLDSAETESISLLPRDNIILYSMKDMYVPDSVEVAGAVFNPGRFEFREGMSAKDLVMQAGGFLSEHEEGRLVIFRGDSREQKVEQVVLATEPGLSKSAHNFPLEPRDFVHVPVDPRWYSKEIVILEGLFQRPGKYALLHPGEKLSSVIRRAGGFKPNAYVEGGRFFRFRDSVGRVGVDIRKAVKSPKSLANIPMVGGDSIYIPTRLNTVKVIGEVGFETSLLYDEGATVLHYIERAGGFTRRSEKDRVVVQYANGETGRDGYFNRKPDAGSTIYVPQGPEPKPTDWIAGINALLGTVGVAAALILSIQAISK